MIKQRKTIVLLGGGHANCQVVKILKALADTHRVILISDAETSYYSGMLPGCIAKQYQDHEIQVDLRKLAYKCDAEFLRKRAVKIEPKLNKILLEDGTEVNYDILSVNIGSRTLGTQTVPGVWEHSLTTRPVNSLIDKIEIREKELIEKKENPGILIVGGGVAGVELGFSMKARWDKIFASNEITMLNNKSTLFPGQPRAAEKINRELSAKSIKLVNNCEVSEVTKDGVYAKFTDSKDPEERQFIKGNVVLWCTGAESHDMFNNSGMKTDRRGFMNVNQYLQNVEHGNIFGAGDCIRIVTYEEGFPPKAGVYAVYEGPVVAENIKRYLNWKPLKTYEPQSDFLKLINAGDGTAICVKYGIAMKSRLFLELKDYIDRKFMKSL